MFSKIWIAVFQPQDSRLFRENVCMTVLWKKARKLQGQARRGLCPSDKRRFHLKQVNQPQESNDLFESVTLGLFQTCWKWNKIQEQNIGTGWKQLLAWYLPKKKKGLPLCVRTSGLTPNFLWMVGIHKCCIMAICWTVLCPIYSGIVMACVKRRQMEMFLNVAAA